MAKQPKRRRRGLWILLVLVLLLIWWWDRSTYHPSRVKLTVDISRPAEPANNAYPLYMQAARDATALRGDRSQEWYQRYDEAQRVVGLPLGTPEAASVNLSEFLEGWDPVFAKAEEALAMEESVAPPVTSVKQMFPDLSGVREIARRMVMRARVEAERGEYAEAFDTCLDAAEMGQDLMPGGALINRLVGISVQAIALDPLCTLLASAPASAPGVSGVEPEHYPEVIRRLRSLEHRLTPFEDTLRWEFASMLVSLDEDYRPRWKPGPLTLGDVAANTSGRSIHWPHLEDVWDLIRHSPTRALREMDEAFARDIKDLEKPALYAVQRQRPEPSDPLSRLLIPMYSRAAVSHYKYLAQLRGARVVAALAWYKSEHGDYPEDLDALVPRYLKSVPRDPMSRHPFRYVRGDFRWGFLLYTSGLKEDFATARRHDALFPLFNTFDTRTSPR